MTFHDEQALGLALKEARLQKGKTQKDVEADSGIPDATISDIENGRAGVHWSTAAEEYARHVGFRLISRKVYELVPLRVARRARGRD